jgi:hypothetical protein
VYVLTTVIGHEPVGAPSTLVTVRLASAVQLSEIATPNASKEATDVAADGSALAEQPLTGVEGIVPVITGDIASPIENDCVTVELLLHASFTVYVLTTVIGHVPVGAPSTLVTVRLASAVQLSEIATPNASKEATDVTADGTTLAEQPLTGVEGIVPVIVGTCVSTVRLIVWVQEAVQVDTPAVYVRVNDSVQPETVTAPSVYEIEVELVVPPRVVNADCVFAPVGKAALHAETFRVVGQVIVAVGLGTIVLLADKEYAQGTEYIRPSIHKRPPLRVMVMALVAAETV